jgi:hypothetical protein
MTIEKVRKLALALPRVEEGTSYGTPAWRVGGKLLARLREDGETLMIKADFDERDMLMAADPNTFFTTDQYRNYPSVLVRLATVPVDVLRDLFEQAWRAAAPRRLRSTYDRRA